jgi:tRNA (guanine-N7-)-methyltransferase
MTVRRPRTYGRTRSRRLRPARAALLAEALPGVLAPAEPFDPRDLRPQASEVWLEVGFGAGEHLGAQAAINPNVLLLGAETYVNGVASLVRRLGAAGIDNVRIHHGDARDLRAALPNSSVQRLFVLFADPWPKARHRRRRLVQPPFVDAAARILSPGGLLRFATDWADYGETALAALLASDDFAWTARRASDWRSAPRDHVPTRYQSKGLGDCSPLWLEFRRL